MQGVADGWTYFVSKSNAFIAVIFALEFIIHEAVSDNVLFSLTKYILNLLGLHNLTLSPLAKVTSAAVFRTEHHTVQTLFLKLIEPASHKFVHLTR